MLKFSSVVVQVKSSEIQEMSVCCVVGNRQSEFDVCTLPDSSQVLELASPAFHLSVLSVSLLHYSGVGFALLLSEMQRGKEIETVAQILEQGLEPSSVGLQFGEKMLEDSFSLLRLMGSLVQRARGRC